MNYYLTPGKYSSDASLMRPPLLPLVSHTQASARLKRLKCSNDVSSIYLRLLALSSFFFFILYSIGFSLSRNAGQIIRTDSIASLGQSALQGNCMTMIRRYLGIRLEVTAVLYESRMQYSE